LDPTREGQTQPDIETGSRVGPAGSGGGTGTVFGASAPPVLGLRLVFPRLAPVALRPDEGEALVLGREGDGPGRLAGTALSRRHAELRLDAGELRLRDLDSHNGMFVNGDRCAEAVLRAGDVVRLGEWIGVIAPVAAATGPVPVPRAGALTASLHLGPTAMQVALRAHRLASTALAVVLEGETGTGKEQFARAIHDWSGRRGPLVAINCAALPESLAEAELFGYREGAFTGAVRSSTGHFRAAHGGTLFLDEVTDMPLAVQAKLLRALEQKEVLPIGESRAVAVDVRVIAATQVPLARAVAEKRLRPDLHARLDGFTLRLPPLRERRADIPSLFLHLLGRHGLAAPVLSPRLVEALCRYDWPLNVRELDFLAQRLALLLAGQPIFRRSHLPDRIRWFGSTRAEDGELRPAATPPVPGRAQLLAQIASNGGNLARAARQLGISRQKAYEILGPDAPERLKSARKPAGPP
jgi:hypothetical protein